MNADDFLRETNREARRVGRSCVSSEFLEKLIIQWDDVFKEEEGMNDQPSSEGFTGLLPNEWTNTFDLRFLYGKLQQRQWIPATGASRWVDVPSVLHDNEKGV